MRSRRSPILISAVTLVACSLVVAGCGGGGSSGKGIAHLAKTTEAAAATATTGGSSPGGELVEYSTCMRSHGVLSGPGPAAFEMFVIRGYQGG